MQEVSGSIPLGSTRLRSASCGGCRGVARPGEVHSSGRVYHTSKLKPLKLNVYTAFSGEQRTVAVEKYLKSHAGRPFSRKRL